MLARYQFTGFWTDKAMDFMRRHKGGPFFVELWPQDVHTPHIPDPEELPYVAGTPQPHHNFNAVLRCYDEEIGRVLDFGSGENAVLVDILRQRIMRHFAIPTSREQCGYFKLQG